MKISSFEQLDEATSNLHDCPFELDRAVFDRTAQTWTGFFLRPLWDDPRAEHRGLPLLYTRTRLPVAEATLKLAGISNYIVTDNARIGSYSFNEIEATSNCLRLHFNEALDIKLELAGGIDAIYMERLTENVRSTYEQFLLLQRGPHIETVAA